MVEDLDPEIAALLAGDDGQGGYSQGDGTTDVSFEDIDNLPDSGISIRESSKDEYVEGGLVAKTIHDVDLNKTSFPTDIKLLLDTPVETFSNPKYYQTVLTGENQSAQRVHQLMSKYLTSKDPKDRAVFRQQIITSYWELIRGMASKMANPNTLPEKRMLIRFGVLLPSLFKAESKEFFSKIPVENDINEPILYMDEWFREIVTGKMNPSMTDEARPTSIKNLTGEEAVKAEQSRLAQLQSKNSGKLQSAENLLGIKESERTMLERELVSRVEAITQHRVAIGFEPHAEPLEDHQRKLFTEMNELIRKLSRNDKEYQKCYDEYKEAKLTFENVQSKLGNSEVPVVQNDEGALKIEFDTVRQMAKMTIGRQGNQFPVFTREFYHCTENGTGTRENVMEVMRWIESLDPGAFCRIHKSMSNRIVPYVLLVPTYGDRGFCWEPFDRYNRVTSRARIVVPMYPKDLKIAVLSAVADLRWQVAKEKASYYWMEEGLTGQYYQWSAKQKLKGDLKEFFIEDYILWMTKESTGVQRLDKEVRGIFWRNMPYPKALKEDLRKRSLVYDELCKKDANREMSDGY